MTTQMSERIAALERRFRVLALCLGGLVIAAIVIGAADSSNTHTVQCRKLEIVDGNGDVIAMVGTDDDGSTGLFVYDEARRVRLAAIHDPDQTAFYALDTAGTIRLGAAQYAHGGGGFALHGSKARGASVHYHKDAGSLTFYDDSGKVIERLPQ